MRFRGVILVLAVTVGLAAGVLAEDQPGNIDIRSTLIGTRVYLDDAYVGDADIFLEDVHPGSHVIILRQGSQRIRTEIALKPGELLMLEGRFDEDRIVDLKKVAKEEAAKRAEAERLAAAQKAADVEAKKQEQAAEKKANEKKTDKKSERRKAEKKIEPKAEPKKVVVAVAKQTDPEQERRDLHLNIIRVDFEENGIDVKVTPRVNQKIITNFNDSSATYGKIVKKQNYILCESGDCSRDWTGRFFYFDETGKRDAFLIRWREIVFTGMTPSGTSKLNIDLCINGDCKRVTYGDDSGPAVTATVDRYVLSFNRKVLTIRRADIMKEIADAGGKVPAF